MKAAVVFFLSLCFLLLGRYDHVDAGLYHNRVSHATAQHMKKTLLTRDTDQTFLLIKNNSLSEKRESFLNAEDEAEDYAFSRKYLSLPRYFIALTYASVLIFFYSYSKNRLPFCKHLSYASSYKYILQRVLRI